MSGGEEAMMSGVGRSVQECGDDIGGCEVGRGLNPKAPCPEEPTAKRRERHEHVRLYSNQRDVQAEREGR